MRYTIPFLFVLTIISCKNEEKPLNKFDDPQFVRIADFQDRRSGDSLVRYLEDTNPIYRKAAALAYASVQDSGNVDPTTKITCSMTPIAALEKPQLMHWDKHQARRVKRYYLNPP